MPLKNPNNPLYELPFVRQCDVLNEHDKNGISAYQLFSLEKGFTEKELKDAYRSLALCFHPDKNSEHKDKSTNAFKVIGYAKEYLEYFLLNSAERATAEQLHTENPFNHEDKQQPYFPPQLAAYSNHFDTNSNGAPNQISTFEDFLALARRNAILASLLVNNQTKFLISLLKDFKQFVAYAKIDSFFAGRLVNNAAKEVAESLQDFKDFVAYARLDNFNAGRLASNAAEEVAESLQDFNDLITYVKLDSFNTLRLCWNATEEVSAVFTTQHRIDLLEKESSSAASIIKRHQQPSYVFSLPNQSNNFTNEFDDIHGELESIRKKNQSQMDYLSNVNSNSFFSTSQPPSYSNVQHEVSEPEKKAALAVGLIGLGLMLTGGICIGLAICVIDSVLLLLAGLMVGALGVGFVKAYSAHTSSPS